MRQSQAVPFYDISGSIKGCQYILKTSGKASGGKAPAGHSVLNLLDQDINNLYTYESRVA